MRDTLNLASLVGLRAGNGNKSNSTDTSTSSRTPTFGERPLPSWTSHQPSVMKKTRRDVEDLCSSLSSLQWLAEMKFDSGLSNGLLSPKTQPQAQQQPKDKQASVRSGHKTSTSQKKKKKLELIAEKAEENIDWKTSTCKPPFAYSTMIYMALKGAPPRKLALGAIYDFIVRNYAHYREADGGWKNSIRHNLSQNKCFTKVNRSGTDKGKGCFWTLAPGHELLAESVMKKKRRKCNNRKSRLESPKSKRWPSSYRQGTKPVKYKQQVKMESEDSSAELFAGLDWHTALGDTVNTYLCRQHYRVEDDDDAVSENDELETLSFSEDDSGLLLNHTSSVTIGMGQRCSSLHSNSSSPCSPPPCKIEEGALAHLRKQDSVSALCDSLNGSINVTSGILDSAAAFDMERWTPTSTEDSDFSLIGKKCVMHDVPMDLTSSLVESVLSEGLSRSARFDLENPQDASLGLLHVCPAESFSADGLRRALSPERDDDGIMLGLLRDAQMPDAMLIDDDLGGTAGVMVEDDADMKDCPIPADWLLLH